jgi:hypothetical protein
MNKKIKKQKTIIEMQKEKDFIERKFTLATKILTIKSETKIAELETLLSLYMGDGLNGKEESYGK